MTVSAPKKHWTEKELLAMPKDGCKRQVIGGELYTMSPAGFDHGALLTRLSGALAAVVYEQKLGELTDGQTGFRVASGDLFCPDIGFVTTARARAQRRKKAAFFQGAPDFFVEVLSSSDTVEVLREKLEQFFAEGSRLAWVVHPRKRCVYVYRSADASETLHAIDTLDGEDVIPGFKLKLAQLFI